MAYLLDADVFIRAKNLHYGLDFCPAFWDWLIDRNAAGSVFSVEKVGDEVQAIEDDLSEWAAGLGPGFFLPPATSDLVSLAAVSAWATGGQRYEPSAVSTFLQVADYYLVAQAHAGKHVVVTHEVPSATKRRIKIPDACIGLGIKCMTPFEVLRLERARFVLGPQR
ncbi:MAG: DUF4411 family protein [Thermoanaerobaculia bacterium]